MKNRLKAMVFDLQIKHYLNKWEASLMEAKKYVKEDGSEQDKFKYWMSRGLDYGQKYLDISRKRDLV